MDLLWSDPQFVRIMVYLSGPPYANMALSVGRISMAIYGLIWRCGREISMAI